MKNEQDHAFFYFTKKERKGIIIILFFNALLLAGSLLYEYYFVDVTIPIAIEEADSTIIQSNTSELHDKNLNKNEIIPNENKKNVLFDFDPNLISIENWEYLGVSKKTALTIQKYISKGGKFREPQDLKKIWGIPESLAYQLMPYVKVKEEKKPLANSQFQQNQKQKLSAELIDLNQADSSALEKLPGIGPKLSQRIISYREKLGGFYCIEQLHEVWGLQDSILEKISNKIEIQSKGLRKININLADFNQLKSHPYIGYKTASAILNYRNQHGMFQNIEEIQKIVLIDEKIYSKIVHYLVT
jgi:competence ComEA-like helix-hairpin-helix protein